MTPNGKTRRAGRMAAVLMSALVLSACAAPIDPLRTTPAGFLVEVPASVVTLAGPGQDLSKVRFRPDHRCFWYLYAGPVEDVMLPLRTAGGNPICAPATDAG